MGEDKSYKSRSVVKKKENELKRLTVMQYILLIFLAVVLITPFVQNMQFNSRIQREISEFRQQDRTESVTSMQETNKSINQTGNFYTTAVDPFEGTTVYKDRAEMLGVLEIPKIDEELSVYDRTDNLSLREGVGLLEGTNLPTGGTGNTTVLTGHNGMAEASIFRNVHLLENGDKITFDNGVEVLTYEVYDTVTVLPHETDVIQQIDGQDTLILLTCITPDITKGLNTHRLVVYAKRVPTETNDNSVKQEPVRKSNTRYILFGIAGIGVIVVVIGRYTYKRLN